MGDACTDESESIVRSFADPRIRWENLTENAGSQWGPNNRGLELARGRDVAYLGHDDLWFPVTFPSSSVQSKHLTVISSLSSTEDIGPPSMPSRKMWLG